MKKSNDPANCITVRFTVGDPSSSQSERWEMDITNDQTGQTRHVANQGYGEVTWLEFAVVRGRSYTVFLRHTGTNRTSPRAPTTTGAA